jgi:hypothetical protein
MLKSLWQEGQAIRDNGSPLACVARYIGPRPKGENDGFKSNQESAGRHSAMTKIPNLYLKWGVFRKLFPDERPDADFAAAFFPNTANREQAFAKLKYGDTGCRDSTAKTLAYEINEFMRRYRQGRGILATASNPFSPPDLFLPVYVFTKRLIEIAGEVAPGQLAAAHAYLIEALTASGEQHQGCRLVIKRISIERAFAGMEPSGSGAPVLFDPARDLGAFSIEEVSDDPAALYVFEIRDPQPGLGKLLWELEWSQTVSWVPSPFQARRTGNVLKITQGPVRIDPAPGRFHLNAVLVLNEQAIEELDPRDFARPAALDEFETARFVTNLKRLAKPSTRWPQSPIRVFTNIYDVKVDAA